MMDELICMVHDDTVEMKYKDASIPAPTKDEMERAERILAETLGIQTAKSAA